MGFGIKTKIKRAIHSIQHTTFLHNELLDGTFPAHPYAKSRINSRLRESMRDLKGDDINHNIGLLQAKVNTYAAGIYQQFVKANANNIGNWSISPSNHGTRQLEYELIQKLIHLYKGDGKELEGYVTSGGSEGNQYSVWVGKAFVTSHLKLNQVCLLKTDMTHYSVDKACSMYSIPYFSVPTNPDTWTMDPVSLEQMVYTQMKRGIYGFVISLTFGYTETGTSDDLHAICEVVKKLKKKSKRLKFSIIIDAAFNGFIEPFIMDDYRPFLTEDVHIFSVDFSKFTAVPFPAGVVLYRKPMRKLIERDVQFFPVPDNTLLGSRPGAAAAAIWGTIHLYGKSGYRDMVMRQIRLKEYFMKQMFLIFPTAEIVTNEYGLTVGVILSKKQFKLLPLEVIEDVYRIYAKEETIHFSGGLTRTIILCKFFFLAHMTKRAVDDLLRDIRTSIAHKTAGTR
jgi:tyrosine decarboxylase/aspartate 1-decarboxylase